MKLFKIKILNPHLKSNRQLKNILFKEIKRKINHDKRGKSIKSNKRN